LEKLSARLRGPKIHPDIAGYIRRVEPHAYRMAWIDNRTEEFWGGPYLVASEKLKKRLFNGDKTVFPTAITGELYPLIRAMRETMHEVYLPVIPKADMQTDKIRLGRGQAVVHFDYLFPDGVLTENPNPLNFRLLEAELDPTFNVEIATTDGKTLAEDLVLEINESTLRDLIDMSSRVKRDLKRRGCEIKSGEKITISYALERPPIKI
jgi:hypothetical protein